MSTRSSRRSTDGRRELTILDVAIGFGIVLAVLLPLLVALVGWDFAWYKAALLGFALGFIGVFLRWMGLV